MQHVFVRFAQRMCDQFVAHEAAIDETILRIATGARISRHAGKTAETQTGRIHFDRQRGL